MKQLLIPIFGLSLVTCSHGATVFTTNTSGNAASLAGDGASDTTTLTLSAADGGGSFDVNTVAVYNGASAETLGMDADGMGVGNSKWGSGPQGWTFTFSQAVSFDGIGFNDAGGNNEGVFVQSDAWIGATVDATGQNWTFNSTEGAFSVVGSDGPTFDFTSAGVSTVTAGSQITIEHNSGNGGSNMTSFTVTPVPEVSACALLAGGLAMSWVMVRRRK
jgi:hypothetical protein